MSLSRSRRSRELGKIDSNAEGTAPAGGFSNTHSALLDGADEYFNCGTAANAQFERTNSFSLSAWIKTTNTNSGTIIGNGFFNNQNGVVLDHLSTGTLRLRLTASNGTALGRRTNSQTINSGAWVHVVATYDGSQAAGGIKLYINGSETSGYNNTNTNLNQNITTTRDWYIGAGNDTTPSFLFAGNLDQVAMWDKALSSTEVTEIYNSGDSDIDLETVSMAANLIHYWSVGEDSDDFTATTGVLTDRVGSMNGTPINTESGDKVADVA